ncbi:unnamed protein product [Coregonus sp. 'balchen']|nr:unnamed protein product [Coregonus sp. 'balchen']
MYYSCCISFQPTLCPDPVGSEHSELLLSLNKKLLRTLEDQETSPNPSVHLALRLSTHHNLGKESDHLNALKTDFHNDIESSLANSQPVVGRLALYTLALKASCYDLNTLTFTVNQRSETLLTHLKRQMALEKEHIAFSHRPLTNYYQYSLGVLALCVSGVRVNSHVSNKLIGAVEHGHIKHGDSDCIDTFAMAGMALQCLKEYDTQVQDAALDKALGVIKQKLLDSQRDDDSLVLEASEPVMVLQSHTKVALKFEVIKSHGAPDVYSVNVPTGTSLVYALELLQKKNIGFTFEKETSLWGPFLSVVNGERARQTDRRYWRLSSDGNALSQGIKDFKIETAQQITIENTSY